MLRRVGLILRLYGGSVIERRAEREFGAMKMNGLDWYTKLRAIKIAATRIRKMRSLGKSGKPVLIRVDYLVCNCGIARWPLDWNFRKVRQF